MAGFVPWVAVGPERSTGTTLSRRRWFTPQKELNVYNALPTLFLSNDHTGSSELCTLFLDPDWRKEGNGYLLSKSRFMFMAAFRDKFNDKVVAEMRGVIDEHGYSPFWQSLGKRFFSMDFSRADFLCGTGQTFIAELM